MQKQKNIFGYMSSNNSYVQPPFLNDIISFSKSMDMELARSCARIFVSCIEVLGVYGTMRYAGSNNEALLFLAGTMLRLRKAIEAAGLPYHRRDFGITYSISISTDGDDMAVIDGEDISMLPFLEKFEHNM